MAGYLGKPNRHIRLKGVQFQFKMGIPANCRQHFGGRQNFVEGTGTGDILTARKWRDRREREMHDLFRDIQSGRVVTSEVSEAQRYGELSRTAYREEEDADQRNLIVEIAQEHSEALKPEAQAAFDKAWSGKEEVKDHIETWLAEAHLAPKTTLDYRGIVNRLAVWCEGKHYSIADVSRKTAGKYVSSELLNPDKMTRTTAKKHLGAIVGYWDHLRNRGHARNAEANPWSDQIAAERGKQGVAQEEERPFTNAELVKVLYPDAVAERGGRTLEWNRELKDLALISVLSGMRLAEITDLTVEACQDGKFDLKKSKTKAGVRVVPIHAGLVAMVTQRCEGRSGRALLFEEFEGMKNPAGTLSKAFTRRRKALGVAEKRDGVRRSLVNFHSFRRTFATKARHADIPEATIQDVVGHDTGEKKSVLISRYAKEASWKQKVDCVEAVTVPDPAPLAP